jgi:pyruvate dehydrogenase E1 component alpha subunit
MAPKNDNSIDLLKTMLKIRKFEEKVKDLFAEGKIPGFVHLYIGEEAIATGVCANLDNNDVITSTHRGHGHCIAKGAEYNKMMAELFGKRTGYCKGKGGSMHIADVNIGILGANGIVGGGIPIATGAAFSFLYKESKQVAVCFFGDGASDQGSFHESLNFASIWNLPILFVCENNLYAESIPTKKHLNVKDIAVRAKAYNIEGITVDGNDIEDVCSNAKKAIEKLRNGLGPILMECKTYRHRGHFEGEPQTYRPKDEVEDWLKKEPIKRFKEKLLAQNLITEKIYKEIEADIDSQLEKAIKFAEESSYPKPEETLEGLYA